MIAALPVAVVFLGNPAVVGETVNTNTNMKTEFVIRKNIKIEDGKIINKNLENVPYNHKAYIPVKSEEEIQREKKLAQWENKQVHLKMYLPQGKFIGNFSAYTASADECGKADGITASGVKVKTRRTLACPPQYPFGTKINISGYGIYVCEDRGGAIKNNKFDIYMETKKEAFTFGRQYLEAEVVN